MQNVIHIMMGAFDDGKVNHVQQYDANSREFICHLWERPGVMFEMAEDAVVGAVFEWRRNPPSKEYETEIVNRSTVVVKVPAAATQLTGTVKVQLKIHQDGGELNSPVFAFVVLESLKAGDKATDEPALLLESLVDRAGDAIHSAENAAQAAKDAAEKLPDDLANEVAKGVKAHDESANAHVDIRKQLKALEGGVVTAAEKEAWNQKSNFSGNYADLNGAPEIPTKLPSPAKLVFTGGAKGEYDGSEDVEVHIPDDVVVVKLDWEGEYSTSSHTYAQITDALAQEKTILLANVTGVYHFTGTEGANYVFTMLRYQQNAVSEQPGVYVSKIIIDEDNNVTRTEYEIADTPSPKPLIITGAAEGTYDGSEEVTIHIPKRNENNDLFIVRSTSKTAVDKAYEEIDAAIKAGRPVVLIDELFVLHLANETSDGLVFSNYSTNNSSNRTGIWEKRATLSREGVLALSYQMPAKTPNPYELKFTGAVEGTYDGSNSLIVNIPAGGEGGGAFVVNVTKKSSPDGVNKWYLDKTFDEIKAAAESGIPVVCRDGNRAYYLTSADIAILFHSVDSDFRTIYEIQLESDNDYATPTELTFATDADIPEKLPNPQPLHITDFEGNTETYNGNNETVVWLTKNQNWAAGSGKPFTSDVLVADTQFDIYNVIPGFELFQGMSFIFTKFELVDGDEYVTEINGDRFCSTCVPIDVQAGGKKIVGTAIGNPGALLGVEGNSLPFAAIQFLQPTQVAAGVYAYGAYMPVTVAGFYPHYHEGTFSIMRKDKADYMLKPEALPAATPDTLGGVRVGDGLTVDEAGVLTAEVKKADVDKISEEIADIRKEKPLVYIDGTIPTTKDNVLATMTVKSKWLNIFAYIKIKCQGTSSMSYPKKNFTVTMYQDEDRTIPLYITIPGWKHASNKFVLKANWIDHLHARNIISARLWSDVVASRPDYDTLPIQFRESPNNGAVDGFPIIVTTNGAYQGVYTWNIGKEDWLWGMDEDNPNHALMCAETNASGGVFEETPCNFRALWSGVNEVDWSVEVGTNSDALKNSLNALISCVKDTDDATFKATIGNYLDVQSAIDYWIFQYVICGIDGLAKNMLLGTYDMRKWIMGAYDLDSTWGLHWDGKIWRSPETKCPESYQEPYSLLFERISTLFADEVKARYIELRSGALNYANILSKFETFAAEIGAEAYADDLIAFPDIPQGDSNNIWQIRNFVKPRLEYCDEEFGIYGENMFDPGADGRDYCTQAGDVFPSASVVVDADGNITGTDTGDMGSLKFRNIAYDNAIGAYILSAEFATVDGGEACPRMVVQAIDGDGNIMSTGVGSGVYLAGYKGFYFEGNRWDITLSDDVATFKVGFVFSAEPATYGVKVKISNIKLTKAAT